MDKNSEMEVGDILNNSEMAFIRSDLRQAGVNRTNSFSMNYGKKVSIFLHYSYRI